MWTNSTVTAVPLFVFCWRGIQIRQGTTLHHSGLSKPYGTITAYPNCLHASASRYMIRGYLVILLPELRLLSHAFGPRTLFVEPWPLEPFEQIPLRCENSSRLCISYSVTPKSTPAAEVKSLKQNRTSELDLNWFVLDVKYWSSLKTLLFTLHFMMHAIYFNKPLHAKSDPAKIHAFHAATHFQKLI